MNFSAILHIPLSNYAHGLSEDTIVFRIRCGKNDIKSCKLHYGDRACRMNPVIFTEEEMDLVASDLYFDYFEVVLKSKYTRICYYFELNDGVETKYYYDCIFSDDLPIERSEFFQLPFNHKNNIAKAPSWMSDAIVYNIFPDSFATSKEFVSNEARTVVEDGKEFDSIRGGTINGIRENIPYYKDLGVNCIYMNPIFKAKEWHKYDTVDYFKIDPCFGTNEDFKRLVDECHKEGIRVIIDGVFNHCGRFFYAFEDVQKNGEKSKYVDWFYGLNFPVIYPDNEEDIPNYDCFAYERKMPKMDTTNEELRNYFLEVGKFWVKEYDIDGWRLDVANEIDDAFWVDFRNEVKGIKPDCAIIGEVWENAYNWLRGDKFDSSMNYSVRNYLRDFVAINKIDAQTFDGRVTDMRMRYYKQMTYAQLNLLDSHDVPRFLSLCKGDERKMSLAVVFLMTFIGIPMVFYGDERGVEGVKECEYRQAMPWNKEKGKLFDLYKNLAELRTNSEALRRGEYKTIYAKDSLYIYERFNKDERIIVLLNTTGNDVSLHEFGLDDQSHYEVLMDSSETNSPKEFDFMIFKEI